MTPPEVTYTTQVRNVRENVTCLDSRRLPYLAFESHLGVDNRNYNVLWAKYLRHSLVALDASLLPHYNVFWSQSGPDNGNTGYYASAFSISHYPVLWVCYWSRYMWNCMLQHRRRRILRRRLE
jgi:hypothetical protein